MKALAIFLCVAAATTTSMASSATAQQVAAAISLTDAFRFEPSTVTIHAGEAVEWRNTSHFPHIVTDDPKVGDASVPPGAEVFTSEEIPAGGNFRHVLTTPGRYRYFCVPHEGIGMVGEITVLPRSS